MSCLWIGGRVEIGEKRGYKDREGEWNKIVGMFKIKKVIWVIWK